MNVNVMDQGPQQWPCDAGLIAKWQHGASKQDGFISEWEAHSAANDLAREVCSFDSIQIACCRGDVLRRVGPRRPKQFRFSMDVELWIGDAQDMKMHPVLVPHEALHDWEFKPWSLQNLTPIDTFGDSDADIAEESDVTSLLAHTGGQQILPDRRLNRQGDATLRMADNPQIAHQGPVPDDQDDADMSDDEDYDDDSISPSSRTQKMWQSAHVFRLRRPTVSFRVRWDDYEALHRSVARALRVSHHAIAIIHEVQSPPEDLKASQISPLLVQFGDDMGQGAPLRMILLDVEFHDSWPSTTPDVVRSAIECVHSTSTSLRSLTSLA